MNWICRGWMIAVIVLGATDASAQLSSVPASCRSQIDARLPGWQLSPMSAEEASYRRTIAPKGQTVYDYDTGSNVRYRTNGVHTYCFEKAGGTYILERGRFRLVVDSD